MKKNYFEVEIKLPRVKLLNFTQKMISQKYIKWMNTKEIVEFTEQRFKKNTKKKIFEFVKEKENSKNEFLYGIFITEERKLIHVGNIKIGPIDFEHKNAEIGYFVGEKSLQRKGIATSAIKEICKIAKKKFKLKKIIANVYSQNLSSKQVLLKNNFQLEGIQKKQFIHRKKRIDNLIFGKLL